VRERLEQVAPRAVDLRERDEGAPEVVPALFRVTAQRRSLSTFRRKTFAKSTPQQANRVPPPTVHPPPASEGLPAAATSASPRTVIVWSTSCFFGMSFFTIFFMRTV
jgi:hypothetical protein